MAVGGDTLRVVNRIVSVNGRPAPVPRNIKFNSTQVKPAGYADSRIFPKGAPFNEDNYGPVVIPRRGDVIGLTIDNYDQWEMFIRREGHSPDLRNGKIYVDGLVRSSYTVEQDYVFGMGDNRDNSLDSRFWGFIPVNAVVGSPLIVYWSWDPDLAIQDLVNKISSVRWGRMGTIVH